nr:MAG TPA: hypothetical protein [Caudoviricetes sp.]
MTTTKRPNSKKKFILGTFGMQTMISKKEN